MAKMKPVCGFGQSFRFVLLDIVWSAPGNGTKTAWSCADVAQDHESGRLLGITLHSVGTSGVVTDRFQAKFVQQIGRKMINISLRNIPF